MVIYTVCKDDTLFSISQAFNIEVKAIEQANGISGEDALVPGQAIIIPAPIIRRGVISVNGYTYPHIDKSTFIETAPYLTYTAIFSYSVTKEGGLVDIDDSKVLALARLHGVAPIMVITTIGEDGSFDSELARAVLENEEVQLSIIARVLEIMADNNYFALDIDFEYVPQDLRDMFTNFVQRVKAALMPYGYGLFIALAPKSSKDQPGLLYEAHDYAALGAIADRVLIMTYEWGYTYGPPMAIAPLPQVEEVLRFAITQIPPEKILMGIPNYGYDWSLPFVKGTPARSISNTEAIEIARRYGAQIQFDRLSKAPFFNYNDEQGREHIVWFEDARSIKAKLDLLRELKLLGVSIWSIMKFSRQLVTLLDGEFNISRLI